MKIAVMCFHKSLSRYPKQWIEQYRDSIIYQTYKNFDIIELNYGDDGHRIFDNSIYFSVKLQDHAEAHNWLIDYIYKSWYDAAANTNVDDVYRIWRLEIQKEYVGEYDIVSSNFRMMKGGEYIYKHMSELSIFEEFRKEHNIIAHPVLMYSRRFMQKAPKLRSEEIPKDDFNLWKRCLGEFRFKILPEFLFDYRVHEMKT